MIGRERVIISFLIHLIQTGDLFLPLSQILHDGSEAVEACPHQPPTLLVALLHQQVVIFHLKQNKIAWSSKKHAMV